MKILSAQVHGYLDYVTVAIFLAAPTLLGLEGVPLILAYVLAIIHFTMTVLTDFPLGGIKLIPFTIHGKVEFLVGLAIPPTPFLLGFEGIAFNFYLGVGIVIFIVGFITDYAPERAA